MIQRIASYCKILSATVRFAGAASRIAVSRFSGAASRIAAFRLAAALFAAVLISSCTTRGYELFTGYAQGGTYSVKANMKGVGVSHNEVAASLEDIFTLVDTTLSGYNRGSILSRRNAAADRADDSVPGLSDGSVSGLSGGCPDLSDGSVSGRAVCTNAVFDEILALSDSMRTVTGGAFNVAGAPVFDVWGFGFTTDSLPSRELLDKALDEVRTGRKLNFNAIAQGFTCDLIARYLHSIGVHDMLVEVGEIYCEGVNPSGEGWTIGIDAPFDGNMSPGRTLSGIWRSDGGSYGVVTSGNYRKFYIRDGKKYSHTIDPRTGLPVQHNLLSATVVVAGDAGAAPAAAVDIADASGTAGGRTPGAVANCRTPGAVADALATYYMVVGIEEAKAHILSTPGVEACLITSDSLWTSPGFDISFTSRR